MNTIAELITRTWALEPTFHDRMALALLSGRLNYAHQIRERKEPYFARVSAGSYYYENRIDKVPTKSGLVAIIPIIGVMSRYGDLCSWGTEDIGSWILEAIADDKVSSIVLEINSPGGSVDGTELLANIVRQSSKPVVAYVTGMAASAAYWVASKCSEIVAETAISSSVGSIGVLATHIDASKFYEKEGYKITIIRSEGSEDKALFNSVEPLTPELLQSTKSELKPIRSQFIKEVADGRKIEETEGGIFTGKMYDAKTALTHGMIDRIGFLGDAVRRADLLARKQL